jgi:hypothetical protein
MIKHFNFFPEQHGQNLNNEEDEGHWYKPAR